jgi:dihydrodipicolinate synthase/N-acetylneuraminate lyase
MGLCGPEMRLPLTPLSEANRSKLRAEMQALGLLA